MWRRGWLRHPRWAGPAAAGRSAIRRENKHKNKEIVASQSLPEDLAKGLFSLSYIPHHRSRKCFLSGFMTNGVTLSLRYQCLETENPMAYNAHKLAEAGYSGLLEPKRSVEVGRRGA